MKRYQVIGICLTVGFVAGYAIAAIPSNTSTNVVKINDKEIVINKEAVKDFVEQAAKEAPKIQNNINKKVASDAINAGTRALAAKDYMSACVEYGVAKGAALQITGDEGKQVYEKLIDMEQKVCNLAQTKELDKLGM